MTEAEQIKALKERLEHWQHKFDELAAENDRLRAELESIRARVPSDKEISEQYHWMPLQISGAIWMRDRIFPNENK